ncbi:MAG TPA: hypothetical protein VFK89_01180 [Actinomycetota bacterium]|nr:hypothetical protein [Actinomycetota bacterium]
MRGNSIVRAAVATAVLAALFVPVSAGGAEPTYVTHDCVSTRMEPSQIMFACGDGGFYVKHLHWSSWYRMHAHGRGVFHLNDCDPSCAGGTFHSRRGTLSLRYRLWCPDVHRWVFKRAKIRYDRPFPGHRRKESFRLYCPL